MRLPVLAYHAVNISGNDYATNDHVAFAADLRLIHAMGLRVVPLAWAVERLRGERADELERCVALSCDDGSDFDFYDLDHPTHGAQRSLFNCMRDFSSEFGQAAQPDLHLTSFVIASPEAREHLDRNCLAGFDWMSERWWRAAQDSGRMAIENHSWDHNHAAVPLPGIGGMERGSFHPVTTHDRAAAQIAAAAHYIDARLAPHRTTLFCYPYGHVNDYLRLEYFPHVDNAHGMRAAFGDGAVPITQHSDRWNLPRYICGWHWKSPEELRAILAEAAA